MTKRLLLIFLLSSPSLFCWDLKDVLDSLSINITKPGVYRDQAAGHYSGGGVSIRMKNRTLTPFRMTPPSMKMGCSGLDMYMGSFSMISSQELSNMMRALGSRVPTYALQLGMKTFSPQIEGLINYLRDLAMELNQFSVEECQMVQSAFASLLPKESRLYEVACQDLKQNGGAKDYFGARKDCNDREEQKKAANQKQNEDPETLFGNYNLLYKALSKTAIPTELYPDLLNIAGTIVHTIDPEETSHFTSLITNQETWDSFIQGGEVMQYSCRDSQRECLRIEKEKRTVNAEHSYKAKIDGRLTEIRDKMRSNTPFSEHDIAFLSSIGETLPLYNYLLLETISDHHIVERSSTLIATHIILVHLQTTLEELRPIVKKQRDRQVLPENFDSFLAELDRTTQFLLERRKEHIGEIRLMEETARHVETILLSKQRITS